MQYLMHPEPYHLRIVPLAVALTHPAICNMAHDQIVASGVSREKRAEGCFPFAGCAILACGQRERKCRLNLYTL